MEAAEPAEPADALEAMLALQARCGWLAKQHDELSAEVFGGALQELTSAERAAKGLTAQPADPEREVCAALAEGVAEAEAEAELRRWAREQLHDVPRDVEAALAAHHCALLAQQQQLTPRKPARPREEAARSPVFALPGSPAADGGGGLSDLMSEVSPHLSDLDASVASVAMRAISQHGELGQLPTAEEAEAELLHCRVDPHPHLLDTELASVGPDEDWRDWLSADAPALGAAEAARLAAAAAPPPLPFAEECEVAVYELDGSLLCEAATAPAPAQSWQAGRSDRPTAQLCLSCMDWPCACADDSGGRRALCLQCCDLSGCSCAPSQS